MPDEVIDPVLAAEQLSETGEAQAMSGEGVADTSSEAETDEQKTARAVAEGNEANRKREEKRQTSFQRRVDELTADKYAERQRADELMKQNQRLLDLYGNRSATQQTQPQDGEPKREGFESYEDFVTARAEYRAEQKVTAALEKFTAAQQETQTRTARDSDQAAAEKLFRERRSDLEKKVPDYQEVIEGWQPKLPDAVIDMIVRHPEGPNLSYHFAKSPELEAKVREAPSYMQGIVLGEILATLKSSAKETSAPAPGRPVGGKVAPSSDGHYSGPPDGYFAWASKHLK